MCYRSCWLSTDLRHKCLGVHFGTPESHLLWLENYTPQYYSGSQHKQGSVWPGRLCKLSQITGGRKVHHQTLHVVILTYTGMYKDTIFALTPFLQTQYRNSNCMNCEMNDTDFGTRMFYCSVWSIHRHFKRTNNETVIFKLVKCKTQNTSVKFKLMCCVTFLSSCQMTKILMTSSGIQRTAQKLTIQQLWREKRST